MAGRRGCRISVHEVGEPRAAGRSYQGHGSSWILGLCLTWATAFSESSVQLSPWSLAPLPTSS